MYCLGNDLLPKGARRKELGTRSYPGIVQSIHKGKTQGERKEKLERIDYEQMQREAAVLGQCPSTYPSLFPTLISGDPQGLNPQSVPF